MAWSKTPGGGYEAETTLGTARVRKVGGRFVLTVGRERVDLGARATFDSAERALRELGGRVRARASGPPEPRGSRPATRTEQSGASPERILARNREVALSYADRRGSRDVHQMLERARLDLRARLEALPPGAEGRFTAERMRATLRQVEVVMGQVGKDLTGVGRDAIRAASERGLEQTVDYLHRAEASYRGITVPLSLDRAALFDNTLHGVQSTLLRQFPSSVARYGVRSIAKFEATLQQGVIQQKGMDAVVTDLVARDSFFEGRQYWAERIVRTEILGSYGRSAMEAIDVTAQEDWPDMRKVLVGFFDDRTGEDTFELDGQCRRPDVPFENWGDRPPFMNTPKRPNCRCTTVPWRPDWPPPPTKNPLWGDVPRLRR